MQHADDVIEVAVVDGIAGVALLGHRPPEILRVRPDRKADDADARHHGLAGREVAELEQLVENPRGLAVERAAGLALLDDDLELLRRVHALVDVGLPLDPEQAQEQRGGAAREPNKG